MITLSALRKRSACRALGVMSLSMAMLVASASSGTSLHATQDEPAVPQEPAATASSKATVLKVPNDFTAEAIEAVDGELAKKITPLLETLFDASQPADARKAAATELQSATSAMSATSPESESLKRRLHRRVLLLSASISASEAPAAAVAPGASGKAVSSAASKAGTALGLVRNGNLWVDYLHLTELQTGSAALPLLQQVRKNLTPADSMDERQRSFMTKVELQELAAAVDGAIAAASYEGDDDGAKNEQQSQIGILIGSLLSYEQTQIAAEAEKSRAAWRVLRNRFPAAAVVLRPVVNEHYFNHNLHFTVSEELLSRLLSDYRSETGCIADCIMGAWVTGSQNTDINVRADIQPSLSTARFNLDVNGNTRSNTKAQKDPATVWTNGNHYFWIRQSVAFDGETVNSSPATISVDTNSRTVGLATKYDRIPIIRGIVRRMAAQKIAESKPQSDALTASRLREEALPKFEDETRQQFSDANSSLQKTRDSLERRGVAPDSISARSSNTHIAVSSRTIGIARIGGSTLPPAALLATGAAAQIHESALNNSIDALGFQGRAVPEKDFAKELEVALSELFQRDIELWDGESEPAPAGEEPEPPTVFVFSNTDPIRVRFASGKIILVLRMGVRQEGREEIPEQIITIPATLTLQDGKVIYEPGNIGVASREEADRLKQVTRANQIRRIMNRRIVRKEMNPTIDLQAAGDKTLPVTATLIHMADGWLTTEFK